jgi:hypothetical protein
VCEWESQNHKPQHHELGLDKDPLGTKHECKLVHTRDAQSTSNQSKVDAQEDHFDAAQQQQALRRRANIRKSRDRDERSEVRLVRQCEDVEQVDDCAWETRVRRKRTL